MRVPEAENRTEIVQSLIIEYSRVCVPSSNCLVPTSSSRGISSTTHEFSIENR